MPATHPFVLLDDARDTAAHDALFYTQPVALFVAHRPQDVAATLAAADAALQDTGGTLAGYIGYEAGLALEPRLTALADERSGADGPLVWLGLFDKEQRIPATEVNSWLEAQAEPGLASIGPLEPQQSIASYLAAFDTLQEAINAGDIYQANLTTRLAGPARGDPLALYAAMRAHSNAGYGGLVFDGSHWLLSFSPELFFSLKGTDARVKPMKGTRPRGRTEEEDAALAEELAHAVKDRSENLMILDLMRNDLSRVAKAGSVKVEKPFHVETYPTVHQMVSTVNATLDDGMGAMDVVRALFPCGSITGAPKIRAMELIQQVEPDARGPYCGAIGRIGRSEQGECDAAFNVAIRTLRLTPGENAKHRVVMGVGGAIVADSDGMAEWRECMVKAGFTRGQAGGHDLIETMRFSPEEGIPLLELHIQRLSASALELGFAFDRHAARNAIQAISFELEEAAKLRLVLSRTGEMALETAPLPPAFASDVLCAVLPLPVVPGDWRLRHKTTDRGFYQDAHKAAAQFGAGEALFLRPDGFLTEGSFTNIFVERDGVYLTPEASLGLLPGVQRQQLLNDGRAREAALTLDDLADGFYLGNALRGLMKGRLLP